MPSACKPTLTRPGGRIATAPRSTTRATNPSAHPSGGDSDCTQPCAARRDGTTHLAMSPLEFMQRLAALVPRPRLHLIRFHGVLAPNAKLRALVVPHEPETRG